MGHCDKMSCGMNTASSDHHRLSTIKHPSTDITAHLDHRITHLTQSILPRQPYLLSVPSDIPYRHSSRFISSWYEGTPFDPSEEQLQYISFLSHQGDHETLLKVEGAWADDYGNRIQDDELSPRTVPNTGQTTPATSTQRKKISLQDYKTKARSPDSSRPPTATRSPQTRPKSPPPETKPQSPDTRLTPAPPVKADAAASPKLSGQDEPPAPPEHASPQLRTSDTPNVAKRRKLSPPFEENRPVKMPTKVESQSKILKMPRLLSPTLPSPNTSKIMPDLLSPLLPASLTLALSSPSDTLSIGSPAIQPQTRTDPVKAILASADLDNSPAVRNVPPPSVNRARSDSQQPTKDSAAGIAKPAKIALSSKPLSKPPLSNVARPSPGPRQRHIIILKYGKKNRKRVEALLKFASRSKKALLKSDEVPSKGGVDSKYKKDLAVRDLLGGLNHAEVKPKSQSTRQDEPKPRDDREAKQRNNVPDANSAEKKRKAGDSPPTAIKKVKMDAEADKRPSTPTPSTGRIPSMSAKSTFSTPKRDIRSAAMRRVESTDGLDAPTPTGERGRVSTPLAAPKPSPQPLTSSISREEERQHWTNMHTKYFALGRTIKNEGASLAPSPNDDGSSGHSPKSVALLVEALLCFMINASAQAQARPRSDPGWATIFPYHIFVFRASRKYPRVHGLVVQLGAVCRQLSHHFDMDRLARDPLPEDFCNSAPTPGSDGNTKTNEDVERYKKQYLRFRDELVYNARCLQTAWLDGPRLLPPEVLKRDFPATWSKRIKDSAQRLQDKPTTTHISTEFYLPLDVNTTAFEAVRFGLAFLQEWAGQEKIDWKTRIDL